MSAINQGRWDALLRRVADLKGPGSKVSDALTELFPMIDVENVPAELLLLGGSRLCMATDLQAAGGAGFFSTCILRNGSKTGVIARLLEINVSTTAPNITLGPTLNSDNSSGVRAFVDTRVFGEGTALRTQGNNNLLVVGSTFWVPNVDASNTFVFRPPVGIAVLGPGGSYQVTNNQDNVALRVNWLWIERAAEPSELNL